jgi:hypothetical protein
LTFRGCSVALFVVSQKRVGVTLRVPLTPCATASAHRIFIPASAFGGCAEITLNAV